MALIPALFLSMFFLIVAAIIIGTIILIGKGGLSMMASRMKLKSWGLLWIPFVGSWYDGMMTGYFLGNRRKRFGGLFLGIRLLELAMYVVILIIPMGGPENYADDYAGIAWLLIIVVGELIIRLVKIFAMLKANVNAAVVTIVGLLCPEFWGYATYSKVPKLQEKVSANVNQTAESVSNL